MSDEEEDGNPALVSGRLWMEVGGGRGVRAKSTIAESNAVAGTHVQLNKIKG